MVFLSKKDTFFSCIISVFAGLDALFANFFVDFFVILKNQKKNKKKLVVNDEIVVKATRWRARLRAIRCTRGARELQPRVPQPLSSSLDADFLPPGVSERSEPSRR